ncbi:hypothetical protein PTKIN_Ptkin19aG0022900 [Pterospermum kingtungense]
MVEELEGVWWLLKITYEEKDAVEIVGLPSNADSSKEKGWVMRRLLIKRPFNKDALTSTFRMVWRVAKKLEVICLDANLFLFKFASIQDKRKGFDRAPWSFDRQLMMFQDYNGDLRPTNYVFGRGVFRIRICGLPMNLISLEIEKSLGRKIGNLIEIDSNPKRVGWGRNIRLRVKIDITKPLK